MSKAKYKQGKQICSISDFDNNGISLSLLSKRSAQHWQYDEDTATEIKFLERLYEKVGADIRGEEV